MISYSYWTIRKLFCNFVLSIVNHYKAIGLKNDSWHASKAKCHFSSFCSMHVDYCKIFGTFLDFLGTILVISCFLSVWKYDEKSFLHKSYPKKVCNWQSNDKQNFENVWMHHHHHPKSIYQRKSLFLSENGIFCNSHENPSSLTPIARGKLLCPVQAFEI